jgi:hypothetical protein
MSLQFSGLSSRLSARAACVLAVLFAGATAWAADAPAYDAEKFLAERSPALVTIKFNLRSGATESDEQSESEITGVAIDPKGLILCSNIQLTGLAAAFSGMGMMAGGGAVPTNIRVVIGDDANGLKAKLLARDSELDLAWIELTEPAPKPLACVDLTKAVKPRIGQQLICMHRMGKYFDREPAIREVRVSAHTRKPRELYILGGSLNADFGLPVFTPAGEPIGIMILPISEETGEEIKSNPFSMLGGISGILDLFGGAILPADEVVKATKRARENPQTQPANEATAGAPAATPSADADEDETPKPAAKPPAKKVEKKPADKDFDQ